MTSLATRQVNPEYLDGAPDEAAFGGLRDLRRLNHFFGGRRILRSLLRRLRPGARFSWLDVGAASGDLADIVRADFPGAHVVCLDASVRNMSQASGSRVAAQALQLPFGVRSFDYVFCSLFLHHFDDMEIVKLLASMNEIARRGVVVMDLMRAQFSYHFLPVTRPVFGWHPLTIQDGQASVAAGFRLRELEQLAALAGLEQVRMRRHWPWMRLSLIANRLQ